MPSRSPEEIVKQTNDLARYFYGVAYGHVVPLEHKFYEQGRVNYHPNEAACWEMACEAQRVLTATDPSDALSEIES